ncbi:PREDICTED: VPS9 domain-containing protein 1 [Condylura cristata]|uniref:VPS9 domain-containing protein 1 n=1 Tax=Condylura cristata TaxID=143302 RepID=UPI000642BE14|nr:PREDICTED: VPS9 domain-containing protein 1 [Condylura cristata]
MFPQKGSVTLRDHRKNDQDQLLFAFEWLDPESKSTLQRCPPAPRGRRRADASGLSPRAQEAYTEYLRSIHYISQVLLEEVETAKEPGEAVPPDTWKMLKLAEQCLERAQSTAAKLGKTHLKPSVPVASPVPTTTSRHRRVYSDEGGKLSPFLPPEIFQKLQVVESQSSKKELTPLEEASVQNQKLKAAYEARRFCSQVALTPEEREQRALYAAVLEYEQDHDWPKTWKAKLKKSPGDLSLVTGLVSHLLSVPDHPIARLLRRLQCAVYRALYPLVSSGAVPAAAPGGCSLPPDTDGPLAPGSRRLRPSQSLYCMPSPPEPSPGLQPPGEPPASPLQPGPADCPPGLPAKDGSFEDLEQFLAASDQRGPGPERQPEPQVPGAPREPLLEQLRSTVRDIHNAIGEAGGLQLGAGAAAAAEPRRPWPLPHSGADDLLPILSFVVLRSGLPQLVSECAALEEFIHEGFLVGEEGYCLTSLQSALSCVELLPDGPWASGGRGRDPPGTEPPAPGAAALHPCPHPTSAAAGRG